VGWGGKGERFKVGDWASKVFLVKRMCKKTL